MTSIKKPKEIILHHYWRSSCSWRVRWALNLKEISYQSKAINLLKSEQSTESYIEQNPNGFVPTLFVDGKAYGESMAIIEWLDEVWPEPALLPDSADERLAVRQLYMTIACGTQPLQNLAPQKYFSDDKEKRLEYARHWISKGLASYEALLKKYRSGTYSFGEQVSLADLCLIPQCYNAKRFNVDLNQFPLVKEVDAHCLATEACIQAAPENQDGAS